MSSNVTVVLAHGGWADAYSWSKVISGLRSAGIKAVTAPLPLTSLQDDVDLLDNVLERVGGPVVLAGHAYAGAVIGSSRAANVQALAYIAALAPDEGETVADVFYRAAPHATAPKLEPDTHGLIWLPDEAFAAAFAPNASAEEQAILQAAQRPMSPNCITVPVPRPLWKDRPSWFLIAEDDHMIPEQTQRFMAERMGATVASHGVDHTPLITAPELVIDLLSDVVANIDRKLSER